MQTVTLQKRWQTQQHELTSKPGITLPDAGIQDFVISLSNLYHTETYSLCPCQRKPAALLCMLVQKHNKSAQADLISIY